NSSGFLFLRSGKGGKAVNGKGETVKGSVPFLSGKGVSTLFHYSSSLLMASSDQTYCILL
ncbi:MAG: hypothetical protein KME65_02105, partial [Candidatus Thiodiazotropha sp. (ex Ctena orbiculata)]|nr:hypothetical protein [Candidatus Thiodiazotropha taylori]